MHWLLWPSLVHWIFFFGGVVHCPCWGRHYPFLLPVDYCTSPSSSLPFVLLSAAPFRAPVFCSLSFDRAALGVDAAPWKNHSRVVFFFFYIDGFFFYVVGAVEFGSLSWHGARELCAILVQFSKVCLDVGLYFFAFGLLLKFDQTLLCEIIGPPHLGDGNSDFFLTDLSRSEERR